MLISLPKGTKEFLVAVITDKLQNTTDLSQDAASVTYTVEAEDGTATDITDETATIQDGMTVLCLIDTSDLDEGAYALFITIDITPQVPILGPFKFYVDDHSADAGGN